MSSPFALWMNRWKLECPKDVPVDDEADELNKTLAKKGREHEAALLGEFRAHGLSVIDIDAGAQNANSSFARRRRATHQAMRDGVDVIFQALLEKEPFRGHADFLLNVPGASGLGDYHYEVWDTKLASSVKPYFVVQLCCYAEMLEHMQGRRPAHLVVALGNKKQERLETDDYFYYYLALRAQFLQVQDAFDAHAMPDPADSKSFGRWSDYAERMLQQRGHPSLIANITRSQIKRLNRASASTTSMIAIPLKNWSRGCASSNRSIILIMSGRQTLLSPNSAKRSPSGPNFVIDY